MSIEMKRNLLFAVTVLCLVAGGADANARSKRDQVRAECERQANAMTLAYRTVMRSNFVRECMVDRGFQSR
jgi:hypothetical protein